MKVVGLMFAAALLLAVAHAQQTRDVPPPVATGTALVSGVVFVGADGAEPSRRTRVTLTTADRSVPGRTTTTDDEGRFTFTSVPIGRFTLQASRGGYLDAAYGAHRPGRPGTALPVAAAAQVTGLTLRLIKGGVITGTIRDANGQPLPGADVTALRYIYREMTGELALSTETAGSTTVSDDRGVYRTWGLPAGNYVLRASPAFPVGRGSAMDVEVLSTNDVAKAIAAARGRGAGPATPVASETPAPRANFAPVFAPNTPDVSQATMIAVKPEEVRDGVDISVRMFRTSRIEGTIRMFDGTPLPSGVAVWIMPSGPQGDLLGARGGGRNKAGVIDRDGRVLFTDVVPGRYLVQASTGGVPGGRAAAVPAASAGNIYWAMADVAVNGADIPVQLTLQPAMTAKGRLAFSGTIEPPKTFAGARVFMMPPGAGGNLSSGPSGGTVGADGAFTLTNVIPGAYRFAIVGGAPPGWTLQSATGNGRDGWDGWLQVAAGENLDIVITYTDKPTEIAGTLRDAAGQPLAEHFIIVFPADRARWIPGTKRIRSTRPGADGQFSIAGLPAGDYLLAAVTDVESGEWNDSTFLDALAPAGIKLTLTAGQKTRQDLQIK